MRKKFKCRLCEREFLMPDENVWNEKMAIEEHNRLYPGHDIKNTIITCDECHVAVEMWRRLIERDPGLQ